MNDTVLITGASGFVGGHLLRRLATQHDLVAWTRSAPPEPIAELARWEQVDLLDRERVRTAMRAVRPAAVYHCAGLPHVAESWSDTAQPLASNVLATHHVLDALRRADVECRVVVTGSAAVYAPSHTPIAEDHPVAASSPYALSKLAQEQLALRVAHEDGLGVIVTRSFNHTGARQSPAFVAPAVARQIALIERGSQDPVIRVGNLETERDLSDVRDVVRAYAALMQSGTPGIVYNVASGVGHTIGAILEALLSRARVPVRIETDPARLRPHDTPALVGDTTRLREATGWTPLISFDQMLDDLLEYWRRRMRG